MSIRRRWSTVLLLGFAMSGAWAAESPVTAQGKAGPLAGTLTTPAETSGKHPLVLMIPGSGPTDRDGNNPMGVRAASLRMLATDLAAQGIASVRVDKRGMFGSASPGLDANKITIDDYADDVDAWVQQLRKTSGNSCVWLLGHSEGALVAEVAATRSKGVCGVIIVSGAGRPAADVLLSQLQRNPANAPLLPQATAAIDALRHGHTVDASTIPAPLAPLFRPAVQGYLISWFAVDPVRVLQQYKGRVQVIQGTDDLQVEVDDAKRLAAARPGIELTLIDGMNHVLKTPAPGVAANRASYGDPDLPLSPALVPAIVAFVNGK
ncbi:alpha/beta hydrolase [Dyella sp. 20L07]|uniref:alpha/beta hydrolase n=1 Tax=Dyella sp. 20L07 TaxID=3384240 RepID=UPI003D2D6CB5